MRVLALSGLLMVPAGTSSAASEGVFADFGGNWRGRGTVSLTDGSHEAIRCRAAYGIRSDGDALSVDVNCASDSYRVHIVANVVAQGTSFSGTWQETTRQVGGNVTGSIPAAGEMQASFQAMGGGLQIGARANGRRQAVTIQSQGSDIQGVSITLKR